MHVFVSLTTWNSLQPMYKRLPPAANRHHSHRTPRDQQTSAIPKQAARAIAFCLSKRLQYIVAHTNCLKFKYRLYVTL